MSKHFNVKVNKTLEFNIDPDAVLKADIIETANSKFHVLQNNSSFSAEIIETNFLQKKYTVKINNTVYTVDISNHLDTLINEMGFTVGASKLVTNIKSPMPGLILDININVGDSVKEDESILILEAMKMENSILSPRDGIIKSIDVAKGEAVDKGRLLIQFE